MKSEIPIFIEAELEHDPKETFEEYLEFLDECDPDTAKIVRAMKKNDDGSGTWD